MTTTETDATATRTGRLVEHSYGKTGIRLAKIERDAERHRFHDLTVSVRLEGDFSASYLSGDNSTSLPTDTMRSTAYVLAQDVSLDEVEVYAESLLRKLLDSTPNASSARADVLAHHWERLVVDGEPSPHAFRVAAGVDTATVVVHRDGDVHVTSGVDELVLCKTTGSQYSDFLTDELTVLAETDDRILASSIAASWTWRSRPASYAAVRRIAQESFERVLATQHSLAVQHTMFAMGEALLDAVAEVAEIHLTMPNRHHVPVDLSPFGRSNANEVFVVLDRPYGLIEARVGRG